jgi:hypothetical protein
MTIDKSGKWWRGTDAADLDAYLANYTSAFYQADRFEHSRCSCGVDRFSLEVDDTNGRVRRTCAGCRKQKFILDSVDSAEKSPDGCACSCGGGEFQLAVAFSHRRDASIKWVTVGARCTACGVLGAYAEWKIDYQPTAHLYEAV